MTSTAALTSYLADWPGVAQVFRLHRVREFADRVEEEVVYGITSLAPEAADATRLLALSRGHWSIENGLHRRRDVTFGEDACRVRKGGSPQILAALRNTLIHLLTQRKTKNFAAALRRLAIKPWEALAMLRARPEN